MTTPRTPRPGFDPHFRSLRRLYARWGLRRTDSRWLSNWVLTNARVDRDWDRDETRVWGYSADQQSFNLVSGSDLPYASIAIFAGAEHVAAVRRMDFWIGNIATPYTQHGAEIHVAKATDILTYNPVEYYPGEFFPFYNGDTGLSVPDGLRVVGGAALTLPSVTIKETVVAPALGPRYLAGARWSGSSVLVSYPEQRTILDWNDPPLWLEPNEVLYVQHFNPPDPEDLQIRLYVNVWVSQRLNR